MVRGPAIRAFLAISVPAPLVDEASRIQEQLRELVGGGAVRWVSPANFHLTIRFFGDLDPDEVSRAREVVRSLDSFQSVPVTLGSVSAFPSPRRPEVLWVGVEGSGLVKLVRNVDDRLVASGFGEADKPWKSHLTLGRVPRGERLRLDRSWNDEFPTGSTSYRVERVALIRSELRPSGPRYTPLETAFASV